MAMTIMNDASAMMTLGELNKNISALGKQLKKVSSGQRINGADDDASGYGISERMRVQIRALNQDWSNTQTGSSLLRVAEGGGQSILDNLRAIRELALNARNDTNTDIDRAIIQKEVDARLATIDDIASTTNYNGRLLLTGEYYSPSRERYVFRTLGEEYGGGVPLDPARIVSSGPSGTVYENTLTGLFDAGLSDSTNSSIVYPTSLIGCNSLDEATRKDREWAAGLDGMTVGTERNGNINRVTLDFSAAQMNGQVATVSDFDGQGFTMMCQYNGVCPEFVSVRFDASQPIGSGQLLHDPSEVYDENGEIIWDEHGDSLNPYAEHHEYVVGIGGALTADDIARAVYEGIKSVTDSFDTWESAQSFQDNLNVGRENVAIVSVDETHNVQISKTADGEYVFSQYTYAMWIYDGIKTDDDNISAYASSSQWNKSGEQGNPLVIHTGTRANQAVNLYFNDMHTKALGIDGLRLDDDRIVDKTEPVTANKFAALLLSIDNAIGYTLNEMTRVGAYLSRLEHTANNLTTASENVTNSESTIRDADMAKEMAGYTKANVLAQAAQSMLAQANQNSSGILSLLQ